MVAVRVVAIRAEVYSRVVGYYRPLDSWHDGKIEEWNEREYNDIPPEKDWPDIKTSNDPVGGGGSSVIPSENLRQPAK